MGFTHKTVVNVDGFSHCFSIYFQKYDDEKQLNSKDLYLFYIYDE